ncbi:MAG TPA: 2-amino-4-hydroxy-6-hydroxymethyldihydropteridine diphosphokinase [bacterium]|nr:2-amino-4-hydroxy-6-hydroxymethyldihydropteridine diphosphokinase [bacterium]
MRYLLGLGSNLGDRLENLARAVAALREVGEVQSLSGVYETNPVGFADQPRFYNMALLLESDLEPDTLMLLLADLQQALGKATPFPNGPRVIDIDILLAEDMVIDSSELTLPHPRMHERLFVLQPLAEVDPLAIHPVLGVTVEHLLGALDPGDPAERVVSPGQFQLAIDALG